MPVAVVLDLVSSCAQSCYFIPLFIKMTHSVTNFPPHPRAAESPSFRRTWSLSAAQPCLPTDKPEGPSQHAVDTALIQTAFSAQYEKERTQSPGGPAKERGQGARTAAPRMSLKAPRTEVQCPQGRPQTAVCLRLVFPVLWNKQRLSRTHTWTVPAHSDCVWLGMFNPVLELILNIC